MSTGLIVSIVVVVIIVVLIGWGVSAYNNLVTLKNRVKNGWAQIDVQLKQRADLIPNLVNTVKGYASHESEVFTQVTAARAGVVAAASNPSTTTAQRAAAENQLSRALFNLQATAGSAEPAQGTGEQDRLRPSVLQRRGPEAQHRHRNRADEHHRRFVPL